MEGKRIEGNVGRRTGEKEGKTEQERQIKRAGERHKKPQKVFLALEERTLHAWYTV